MTRTNDQPDPHAQATTTGTADGPGQELEASEPSFGSAPSKERAQAAVASRREAMRAAWRRLCRHLWHEAIDVEDPYWPQPWLAVLGGLAAACLLLPLAFAVGVVLLAGFRLIEATTVLDVVSNAVERYLDAHARPEAGLPAGGLLALWRTFGIVALIASAAGNLGGRIAWALFGGITVAMVWDVTPTEARGVNLGLTVLCWSALSLLAFGQVRGDKQPGRRQRTRKSPPKSSSDRERAHRSARKLGFAQGLEAYFEEHGNMNLQRISADLNIPRKLASELRLELLEEWMVRSPSCSPAEQRSIVADLKSGVALAEVAKRRGVPLATVRTIASRFVQQGGVLPTPVAPSAPSA